MKSVKRGFVIGLALLTALFLLASLRGRRQRVSEFENRFLTAHPDFSWSALLDGSYFSGWDEYLADHVAWRDEMMRDWLWLRLHVKRQLLVNDVFLSDEALLPYLGEQRFGSEDYASLAEAAVGRLDRVRQAAEQTGGRFLFFGVEGQSVIFRDGYPSYLSTHVDYYERCASAFRTAMEAAKLPAVYLRDVLEADGGSAKPYYSAVDHHYNLLGAYESYAAICRWCREQGLEVPIVEREALNIRPSEAEFLGTYNRKLYGLSPITDPLLIFDASALPAYQRWDDGKRTDAPLLQLPKAGARIQYSAYMGGDLGETVIRTDRPELPNVLIVGDSFTNPVEALLVGSFNEIRSLDFRKYTEMTLTEYLQAYPADVVVVLRDSLNYVGDEGNGDLK